MHNFTHACTCTHTHKIRKNRLMNLSDRAEQQRLQLFNLDHMRGMTPYGNIRPSDLCQQIHRWPKLSPLFLELQLNMVSQMDVAHSHCPVPTPRRSYSPVLTSLPYLTFTLKLYSRSATFQQLWAMAALSNHPPILCQLSASPFRTATLL